MGLLWQYDEQILVGLHHHITRSTIKCVVDDTKTRSGTSMLNLPWLSIILFEATYLFHFCPWTSQSHHLLNISSLIPFTGDASTTVFNGINDNVVHWRIQGGARDPITLVQFRPFLCSFRQKFCQIIGSCPKPKGWLLRSGKSCIHHCCILTFDDATKSSSVNCNIYFITTVIAQ